MTISADGMPTTFISLASSRFRRALHPAFINEVVGFSPVVETRVGDSVRPTGCSF